MYKELLHYNEETGDLTWKERPREMFKTEGSFKGWNTKYSGSVAGYVRVQPDGKRYISVRVFGKSYPAHRLIWNMQTGEWPKNTVDHEDGDGTNNRWSNLRKATYSENSKNMRRNILNTSGITGVKWDASRNKWLAYIKTNGVMRNLGRFDLKDDAVRRRKEEEKILGFHVNHGTDRPL